MLKEEVVVIDFLSEFLAHNAKFIIGAIVNIFIIYIACKIIDLCNRKIMNKLLERAADSKSSPFLSIVPILFKTLKIVIAFVVVASFLQSCGYNVTSLLAGLGITGLALGFAAKETLGNILGSFSIIADSVYRIGDYIRFDDKAGYVEKLNLRSTSLRTVEGFLINVPNNILSNTCVTNVSHTSMYKIDIKVQIECSSTPEQVKQALDIIQTKGDNDNMIEPGSLAYIEAIEDTAITLRYQGYTKHTKWRNCVLQKSNFIMYILEEFQKTGIELDFPDSRLTIKNPANENVQI